MSTFVLSEAGKPPIFVGGLLSVDAEIDQSAENEKIVPVPVGLSPEGVVAVMHACDLQPEVSDINPSQQDLGSDTQN